MKTDVSPAPRRWRVWLTLTLVFCLGAGIGAGATALLGLQTIRRTLRSLPEEGGGFAERAAARIGADIRRELDLTDEQATSVQHLLDVSAGRMRTIRRDAIAQVAAELRGSTQEIAATLPPEKRAAFLRLIRWRFERLGLQPPGVNEEISPDGAKPAGR